MMLGLPSYWLMGALLNTIRTDGALGNSLIVNMAPCTRILSMVMMRHLLMPQFQSFSFDPVSGTRNIHKIL